MAAAPARVTGKTVIALLLFQTLALFARSLVELELVSRGFAGTFANYLSYLIVPATLAVFCWPIVNDIRVNDSQVNDGQALLRRWFEPACLTLRTLASCLLIGILLRLAWWSQLVASIAFGWIDNDGPPASPGLEGPYFAFSCESAATMAVYVLSYVCLAPLIEEVIHRGYLLQAFMPRGRVFAIAASSTLFALFHAPGTILNAFVFGIVAAVLAIRSVSLWPSLIVHLTYNGLIALDWLCLRGSWNPRADFPSLAPQGLIAVLVLGVCAGTCVVLIRAIEPGPSSAPARPGPA